MFVEIDRNEVPNNAVILPSKIDYAIKNVGFKDEEYKAHYTAGGHLDKLKIYMIHDASNIKHSSVRLTASTAAVKALIIW